MGGGAAPEHHTDRSLWKERIARARLLSCHILIPGWAHLGTDLHRAPWQRVPPQHTHPCSHSGLQLSALPPLYCSSLVSGTHPCTHTCTHQSHPNNWPASCLSRPTGGVERESRGGLTLDVMLVCVPYNFTAI